MKNKKRVGYGILIVVIVVFSFFSFNDMNKVVKTSGHFSWVNSPDDIKALKKNSQYVIRGTFVSVGDSIKNENDPIIYTPYKFKINKVKKGILTSEFIDIYVVGGTITAQEYVENTENNLVENDIKFLSPFEKRSVNIISEFTENPKLKNGDVALLFFNLADDGNYYAFNGGQGIYLKENKKKSYKNINKVISLDDEANQISK